MRVVQGPIDARVEVPGSKSIANRALVCAALADGTSLLRRVPDGDDTAAMVECLAMLDVPVEPQAEQTADALSVAGNGGRLPAGPVTLQTRLAGTTSRFLTAFVALGTGPYVVDGLPPLRSRPMAPLHDALATLGASVTALERPGHLPVRISGPAARAAALEMPGDVSSQYVSALMMIGPLLGGGLEVRLTTPLVSRPYVEMTAAVMGMFGVTGVEVDERSVRVARGRYRACDTAIEPDASSASYPFAAAAICGGRVVVPDLHRAALQGDVQMVDLLERMGCTVTDGADGLEVASDATLTGIDVDMADISDLVPTVAAVAAFASSPTRIRGVGFIRGKESDRIGDLCAELRRAGIDADEHDDGLTVSPSEPHAAVLEVHHDHRLAMAFGVIGTRVAGIELDEPAAVAKSWPGFWSMLDAL